MTELEINTVCLTTEPSVLATIPCYIMLEEPQIPVSLEVSYYILSDPQVFFAQTSVQVRIKLLLQWGLLPAKCICYLHVSLPLRLKLVRQIKLRQQAGTRIASSFRWEVGC